MSSLFKRGTRYALQFYNAGRSPAKKQVSLGTSRKRTARQLQAELDDLHLRGLYDPWVDDWQRRLEEIKRPNKKRRTDRVALGVAVGRFRKAKSGLSPSTQRSYGSVLRLFEAHLARERGGSGPVLLSSLRPGDVTSFLGACDLNLTSKHTYLRQLGVFIRWAERKGWMDDITQEIALQRKPEKKPKAFTKEEARALAEHAKGYLRPLVVVGVHTGLRRSELVRLRWEDVDLEGRELHVRGQTKSGKERSVPLSAAAVVALAGLLHREGHVFYTRAPRFPIGAGTLTHAFLALRREVLPRKRDHSLHSLRHTYCTWLAEAGVPVHVIKRLAGHASIETTMRYVHALSDGHEHVDRAFG